MQKAFRTVLNKFIDGRGGHFAIWFAILAVPMLLGISIVLDMQKTTAEKANIKNALDTAVLAAVSDNSLTIGQKRQYAREVFKQNYRGDADYKIDINPTDGRVEMTVSGSVDTSLGLMVGRESMEITSTSVAVMDRANTICVMSLAPDLSESIRFLENAEFSAPTCSVQSNSDHATAVVSRTTETPEAKSFCSVGGAAGMFDPYIRSQCSLIADPFADRTPPVPGPCMSANIFNQVHVDDLGQAPPGSHNHTHRHGPDGTHAHPHLANQTHHHVQVPIVRLTELGVNQTTFNRLEEDYDDRLLTVEESQNYTGHSLVLQPGTYCGGLTVDGVNVVFQPGTYIMLNGPLTFKNRASAVADGVTFVMDGFNSVLTVETGSDVFVKAPSRGDLAGLAFFQARKTLTGTYPDGVNLIHSGGSLNVVGTLYFPTQAVDIFGDSELGAESPATSFIAYQLTFADDMEAEVRVDNGRAGLPSMQPVSDDGARLVE